MTHICNHCKTEFSRDRQRKYCSFACAGLARRKLHIRACGQCGKSFPSEKYKRRKYCSKECFGLAHRRDRLSKVCPICDNEFSYRACTPNVKFCSMKCMGAASRVREELKCQTCQQSFYPSKKNMRFCSPECSYASHPQTSYKSISINTIPIQERELFKEMFSKRGNCHEHRLVMARKIGRSLKSTEIVHHLNGIKRDNRIENLELLESKKDHHTGYGDKVYQELEEAKARIRELEYQLAR